MIALARTPSPVFVADNPPGMDGTKMFPEFHRLIGGTKYAKVVDVVIPPNTAEKPHTHQLRSIMFTDRPTSITVTLVDKQGKEKIVFTREQTPPAEMQPNISCVEPEPLHYVRNTDAVHHYRGVRIEIKSQASSPKSEKDAPMEIRTKNVTAGPAQDGVEIWAIDIKPGKSVGLNSQSSSGMLVSTLNTAVKVWKWAKEDMEIVMQYPKPEGEIAERPKVWGLNKQSSYQLLNESDTVQRVYCVEIKA